MFPSALPNTIIRRYRPVPPGEASKKWTALAIAMAVFLSACGVLAFDPATKADEILTKTGARRSETFCQLQEFKRYGETQVCASHTLEPDETRWEINDIMRYSRARPKTEWESIEGGYVRRYGYGRGGDFNVAISSDTMLIMYFDQPENSAGEVVEVPPEKDLKPVPLRCRGWPC